MQATCLFEGYALITCRGQFSSRESARFGIIVQNDFSHTFTHMRARTQTHARMHGLLANPLMPQHNGALLVMQLWIFFFARKQGALCCCFRAFFKCFRARFPHVRIVCNILQNIIIVTLISARVCFADLSILLFCFLVWSLNEPSVNLSMRAHVSSGSECGVFICSV